MALVILLFSLGLLAKPMLVTLPALLLLLDVWPLNRISWTTEKSGSNPFSPSTELELVLEKTLMFVLASADGLMTIAAQRDAASLLSNLPVSVRLANSFHAVFWYLSKTFWPTNLAAFYPHPEDQLPWMLVLSGVVIVIVISIISLISIREMPHRFVGWFWFLISLLPVIGLLQVGGQAYADRYAYVPHVGLFVAIVWEVSGWIGSTKAGQNLSGLIFLTVSLACGALTWIQVGYWHDSRTLWTHAIDVDPDHWFAHFHLADAFLDEKKYEEAIEQIALGLMIRPDVNGGSAHYNWGQCLLALGRLDEAEVHFRESLKHDRDNESALDELGKLLRRQGRNVEADQVLARHAVVLSQIAKRRPDDARIQLNQGLSLARSGRVAESIPYFEKAIQSAPNSAAAYNNLALALSQLDRKNDARKNFERAIELNPNLAVAHFNLADILEADRDIDRARHHFAEALRLKPDDAEAAQRLKNLKVTQ